MTTTAANPVVPANTVDDATAVCPAGTQVISGGADQTGGGFEAIAESGMTGNGWFVTIDSESAGQVTYSVEANCLVQ